MSRHRATRTCTACGSPVRDTVLCKTCLASIEADLGDIGALIDEADRVFTTDARTKGSDEDPLLHSRTRRRLPVIRRRDGAEFCPINPTTLGPVLALEPMPPGAFGRTPSTRWDADHGLGREIDATVARQTATGRREGARGSSKPLPFNDRAAGVARQVHARLDVWVHALHVDGEPWPARDVVEVSRWLLARLPKVARHPAAASIERDVRRVVADLRRAVDRPADRWFMGPCDSDGCLDEHLLVDDDGRARVVQRPTELYANPGAEVVRCGRCRVEYDVAERRAYLLAAAEDQLAHAELIGRAAPALGIEITPNAVRGYAHRGRIVEHGTDLDGRPLYRVGDVIAVAQEVLAHRAEQTAKRAEQEAKRLERAARHAESERSA